MPVSVLDFLTWPLQVAGLQRNMAEAVISAQRVVTARLQIIATAMHNPLGADHAELWLMVSEKVRVLANSSQAVAHASGVIHRTAVSNAMTLNRVSGSDILLLTQWTRIADDNMSAAVVLLALPAAAFAPIHLAVTANDRRLDQRSRRSSEERRLQKRNSTVPRSRGKDCGAHRNFEED
jgi:hypothetical protein